MDAYMKQMELMMQSDQFKQQSKGKNSPPLSTDQMLQCFQMYMNSQQHPKPSTQIDQSQSDEEQKADDASIEQDEPIPQAPQHEKPKEVNNIDDIPIQPKKVDFNKLVEQELERGEYQGSDNPNPVRFEYKKRPKYIDKFKVSEPTEVKKYKYYSDNFKSKPSNDDDQAINYHNEVKQREEEEAYPKRAKSGTVKRVAPVMPQKKKEMFSRGVNHAKTNQPAAQKGKSDTKNTQPIGKDVKANAKKDIESLWSDYQPGEEDKEFLEFNTTKQVRNLMNESKANKSNIAVSNKNMVATSTESVVNSKKNMVNSTKAVPMQMPMDDSEFNEQVNRILNQKVPSAVSPQLNQKQTKQVKQDDSQSFDHNIDDYYHNPNINEAEEEGNDSPLKVEDGEDKAEEEDNRDIYHMYSEQFLQKETVSKLNPQPIEQKQSIMPEQSKIINKYFKPPSGKKPPPASSLQPSASDQKPQEVVQSLVNDKIDELNVNIDKLKKENAKVAELKSEYERLTKKLRLDIDDYSKRKESERIDFEKMKEEEMKKIERERKIHLKNTKLLQNLPSKKEREEIDNLKELAMKLQEEMKLKDQRNKLAMDRLKKQLEESHRKNEELQKEIKVYEELRLKNSNKAPPKKQPATISHMTNYNSNGNSAINDMDNEPEMKNTKSSKSLSAKMPAAPQNEVAMKSKGQLKPQKESQSKPSPKPATQSATANVYKSSPKEFELITEHKSSNNNNGRLKKRSNHFNEEEEEDEEAEDKTGQNHQSEVDEEEEGEEDMDNPQDSAHNNLIEGATDTFEMVFLEKYHSTQMSNQLKLTKQDVTPDGKIIKVFDNNKREVIFPSGLKKEIFPDGYQISYFHNHDIKQLYPDGKEVYLFSENNTVHTKLPNGVQVFRFSNGQIEKNFPDGTKIVHYPEGTIRNIYSDGYEEIFFNDGSLQKIHKGGTVTIEYPDGVKDTIYPNGVKKKEYPDGKVTKTNAEGATQSFYKG